MGLRISTNTQAIAAQRNLGLNFQAQKSSLEHLASGSRIVRAADDAAGLAISENLKGQIRSVRQDVRNAGDGISMVQTAEGAMSEVGNILIRFRELSIQSASDTIGDRERAMIDKEVQQLAGEVNRISIATEYGGRKLLNGEGGTFEIQIGTGNDPEKDRFGFDMGVINATSDALGITGISVATKEQAQENLTRVDEGLQKLVENRATLGAIQNRLQSAINYLNVYDENMSAANSRIRDVDMATETTELVKNNILSQSGVSVLSQANNNNMLALKLLS